MIVVYGKSDDGSKSASTEFEPRCTIDKAASGELTKLSYHEPVASCLTLRWSLLSTTSVLKTAFCFP